MAHEAETQVPRIWTPLGPNRAPSARNGHADADGNTVMTGIEARAMTTAAAPRVCAEAIPAELRDLARWVTFQVVRQQGGKTKKTPWISGLVKKPAAVDDPRTWRSFTLATRDAGLKGQCIGFAFDRTLDYVFIDIDDALTPEGDIRPDAMQLITQLDTYTEISQSGRGLHLIGRGRLPERFTAPAVPPGCPPIEAYPKVGGRFGILTGQILPGFAEVRDLGKAVAELFPERVRVSRARAGRTRSGPTRDSPPADKDPAEVLDSEVPGPEASDAEPPEGTAGGDSLTREESDAIVAWAEPFWTPGRRHHLALYLSGELGRQGVLRDQAVAIIARCAVGDDDAAARTTACHDTFDALEAGEEISGFHGLRDACGLAEAEIAPLTAILDGLWRADASGTQAGRNRRRRRRGTTQRRG